MKSDDARDAGQRLKVAIHVARARTEIPSDMQLAVAAGVHYDTIMNWFSGRTTPRPGEVRKVAGALGIAYGDLLAAYDGREPDPQPLSDAVHELVVMLREWLDGEREHRAAQNQAIAALLRAMAADIATPDREPVATMDVPPRPKVGNGT